MPKKYFYELDPKQLVAHADGPGCLTVQQADVLGGKEDHRLYLDRTDAAALRDAISTWLDETAEQKGS